VIDDGQGLEQGFALDSATGLGLSIVRTLVTTELNGRIAMRPATADDLLAAGLEQYRGSGDHGTVVELVVPLAE
jgi:two-component system, sensor histidine kinase PdtaS